MTDREMEEWANRDVARRQWSEGLLERLKALQTREKDHAAATAARDAALAERDKLVKDAAAKKARFEREAAAALTDLNKVLTTKMQTAEAELAAARQELAAVQAKTVQAREARAEAERQHVTAVANFDRTQAAITASLARLEAEERAIKERFAAALK